MDYIFDIDGTIADCDHRLHYILTKPKNWRAFDAGAIQDAPIRETVVVLHALHCAGNRILLVTGRNARNRDVTIQWLKQHDIWCCVTELYMRPEKDFRPDHVVKEEILDAMLEQGYNPVMAFEDRQGVVDMWRRRGIRCAQVAPGDF